MVDILKKRFNELTESDIRQFNSLVLDCLTYTGNSMKLNDKVAVWLQIELAHNHSSLDGINMKKSDVTSLFYRKGRGTKEESHIMGHYSMISELTRTLSSIDSLHIEHIRRYNRALTQGINKDICKEYRGSQSKLFGFDTCPPEQIEGRLVKLLSDYISAPKTLHTMCILHARYMAICPFEIGNIRTGLAILFRECLRGGVLPIIVRSTSLNEYINAILEAKNRGNIRPLGELFNREQEWVYNNIQELVRREVKM